MEPSICVSTNRHFDPEDSRDAQRIPECNLILASETAGVRVTRLQGSGPDGLARRVARLSLCRKRYAKQEYIKMKPEEPDPRTGCHSIASALESMADSLSPASLKIETGPDSEDNDPFGMKRKREGSEGDGADSSFMKRICGSTSPGESFARS